MVADFLQGVGFNTSQGSLTKYFQTKIDVDHKFQGSADKGQLCCKLLASGSRGRGQHQTKAEYSLEIKSSRGIPKKMQYDIILLSDAKSLETVEEAAAGRQGRNFLWDQSSPLKAALIVKEVLEIS